MLKPFPKMQNQFLKHFLERDTKKQVWYFSTSARGITTIFMKYACGFPQQQIEMLSGPLCLAFTTTTSGSTSTASATSTSLGLLLGWSTRAQKIFVRNEGYVRYIRYVDDFIILHQSKKVLQEYERKINIFIKTLKLELHLIDLIEKRTPTIHSMLIANDAGWMFLCWKDVWWFFYLRMLLFLNNRVWDSK